MSARTVGWQGGRPARGQKYLRAGRALRLLQDIVLWWGDFSWGSNMCRIHLWPRVVVLLLVPELSVCYHANASEAPDHYRIGAYIVSLNNLDQARGTFDTDLW